MLGRLRSRWRLKLVLGVVLSSLFWAGYGTLGRDAWFPLWQPPLLWPDTAIAYQPIPWVWVYLSIFPLTALLPCLLETTDELRRCAQSIARLSLACFVVFLLVPVASPRSTEPATDVAMRLLLAADGTLNAFPSLHAGFVVLLGRLARRLFGRAHPMTTRVVVVVWGAAVLHSTIATRQHYAIDLVAGAFLGWLADWSAWRGQALAAATTAARSSGAMSQSGSR